MPRAQWRRQAVSDPALGRQRQVELHRLAGAPAHRPAQDGRTLFDSIIVVTDRRILDQQIRDTIKQFAQVGATVGHAEHSGDLRQVHRERQEDHHHDGAEVPVHPRRDRERASGPPLRHHHRRGPFQPGRPDLRGDEHRAVGRAAPKRRTRPRGHDQPDHGGHGRCCPTPATSPSRRRRRTRPWRSSASRSQRTAASSTVRSTATR